MISWVGFFVLAAAECLLGFGIMAAFGIANGLALEEDHGLLGFIWGCSWALIGLVGLAVWAVVKR